MPRVCQDLHQPEYGKRRAHDRRTVASGQLPICSAGVIGRTMGANRAAVQTGKLVRQVPSTSGRTEGGTCDI